MKIRKLIALTGAALLAMSAMTGCGSQETETTAATTETETTTAGETTTEAEATTAEAAEETLSGSISMSGSTSMEKVANALRESFMEKYPDVSVSVEFRRR